MLLLMLDWATPLGEGGVDAWISCIYGGLDRRGGRGFSDSYGLLGGSRLTGERIRAARSATTAIIGGADQGVVAHAEKLAGGGLPVARVGVELRQEDGHAGRVGGQCAGASRLGEGRRDVPPAGDQHRPRGLVEAGLGAARKGRSMSATARGRTARGFSVSRSRTRK